MVQLLYGVPMYEDFSCRFLIGILVMVGVLDRASDLIIIFAFFFFTKWSMAHTKQGLCCESDVREHCKKEHFFVLHLMKIYQYCDCRKVMSESHPRIVSHLAN